jgi:hypothetical protein
LTLGESAHARAHRTVPTELTPDVLLVLATMLATLVLWQQPLDLAPHTTDLSPTSVWAGQLKWVLRTPPHGHTQLIVATDAAGDVAVHSSHAHDGLTVTSVAAAPGVPSLKVRAAAYELATTLAENRHIAQRSRFDPGRRAAQFEYPLRTDRSLMTSDYRQN